MLAVLPHEEAVLIVHRGKVVGPAGKNQPARNAVLVPAEYFAELLGKLLSLGLAQVHQHLVQAVEDGHGDHRTLPLHHLNEIVGCQLPRGDVPTVFE